MFKNFVRDVLGIPLPQQRAVGLLFLYSFLTSSSYFVARTVGDSLFLSQRGISSLPEMFLFSAIAVGLSAALANRLGKSVRILRIARTTRISLVTATLLLDWLDGLNETRIWAVSLLYILAEVRGCLNTIQLTSLLAEVFQHQRAKSAFAVVAAGAPMAGIATGIVMGSEILALGGRTWLIFLCGLDLFAVATLSFPLFRSGSTWQRRLSEQTAFRNNIENPLLASTGNTNNTVFLIALMTMTACKSLVLTMISYQWKSIAAVHFQSNEALLTAYFARFYAVTDSLILMIQLFATGRLLNRIGTSRALQAFPVLCALIALLLLQSREYLSSLLAVTIARAGDVYRRSIYDVATAELFLPLEIPMQRKYNAVANGIVKPATEAAASVLIRLCVRSMGVLGMSQVWILFLPVWLGAILLLSRNTVRHEEGKPIDGV
ncbi:MAG: hypothetical protein KDA91_03880 [Planctomycetaceae bacterium]|nr:hypothetical protein [Planctomycetaceae bacterium]